MNCSHHVHENHRHDLVDDFLVVWNGFLDDARGPNRLVFDNRVATWRQALLELVQGFRIGEFVAFADGRAQNAVAESF